MKLFDPKFKKWGNDRKSHFAELPIIKQRARNKEIIWMHCASLGEYEQGIPLINELKTQTENYFFVISFFSPSGYEQRNNTKIADAVIYLPIDTKKNANRIVVVLKPKLFIGVKYEFWWNLLHSLKENGVKTIYISNFFNEKSYLFHPQLPFKDWLNCIDYFFTQDNGSVNILKNYGYQNALMTGDTRALSVTQRKKKVELNKIVERNILGRKVIIYGSIYISDVSIIKESLADQNFLHILVPHNVEASNVSEIIRQIGKECVLYSDITLNPQVDILVVDSIGLLFDIYQYGSFAYIGGGFESAIHNTLEPAVFGLPIAFGPKHKKFKEASEFIQLGIAHEVKDGQELKKEITTSSEIGTQNRIKELCQSYFENNLDSVSKILGHLKSNNYLTFNAKNN